MPFKDKKKRAVYVLAYSRRPAQRAYQKLYRDKYPQTNLKRESMLRTRYKMSVADYDRMLKKQQGKCGACKTKFPTHKARWFDVDHNHVTGKARGLLCRKCNLSLHILENKPYKLKLETYLAKHA